jgi:mono/diheme cytochrome c family protein
VLILLVSAIVASANPEGLKLYEERVKPLFLKHCTDCHGGRKTKGGLDLTKRVNMMQGGDSGAAVVPGDRHASLLFKSVLHTVEQKMPHKKDKLSKEQIESIGRWIDLGASYPPNEVGTEADVEAAQSRQIVITDEDRAFWAFTALTNAEPPTPKHRSFRHQEGAAPKTAIDKFLYAAQQKAGLTPTAAASRRTLIRRLSFDIIGLPPAPQEVQAFVDDSDPAAYEKLVDRLLASPHYGERWGRHWLDLARFAESHGYEADHDRPNAYSYRDAVIKALNRDLPYDQFIKWQLAGDEYAPYDLLAVTLTGFIAAGPWVTNSGVPERVKWEKLDDIVSATGEAMLGLTFGCARCHDHKYDPVSARDYYGLAGIFANHKVQDVPLLDGDELKAFFAENARRKAAADESKKQYDTWLKAREREWVRQIIEKEQKLKPEEKALLLGPELKEDKEWQALRKAHAELFTVNRGQMMKAWSEEFQVNEKTFRDEQDRLKRAYKDLKPKSGKGAMVVNDNGATRQQAYFLDRGDRRHKSKTEYQFVEVLMPNANSTTDWLKPVPKGAKTSYSRKALAEWMTDTKAGAGRLLARVIVNRLWQHHFGKGIVATPSNFGAQGAAPSHPELLDWLATNLIQNGWSLKYMHKQMLMTAAYQRATTSDLKALQADPSNTYLSYRRPLRLEAEAMRDSILTVSGVLNRTQFGVSVKPWIHGDAIATGSTLKWPIDVKDGPETWRRSIYIYTKRSMLMPMLESFDLPDSTRSCGSRNTTTVASAALLMLNNAFVRDQAHHLATRVEKASSTVTEQVQTLYGLALARPATREDILLGTAFIKSQAESLAGGAGKPVNESHQRDALVNYCQAVMGLNEFLYID